MTITNNKLPINRRYSSTVEAKGDTERELLSLAAKVPSAAVTVTDASVSSSRNWR